MINYPLKQKSFYLKLIILSPAISFAQADKIFKENSKAVVVVITYNEKVWVLWGRGLISLLKNCLHVSLRGTLVTKQSPTHGHAGSVTRGQVLFLAF